ncbi:Bax inhibitor-1/YccA family protein [Candidatus Uabimicrobium amorphum]|uniref:Membrane protein n=1 Tax=Uabimicrobium amorphum TaxID=2596890 RepID=A0A5S9IT93_UABAM|nr:Bax inhibitor-1/YccA family protein [Candidatus Uabimicrobium amorphum]BBM87327.1 membrane protein [Candidatus Uabimicrobium amorphum]
MRSSNPALTSKTFDNYHTASDAMTLSGTANKTFFLLVFVVASASITWRMFVESGQQAVLPYFYGGLIASLILAIVTIIKKESSAVTAPLYAIAEGLSLGALSAIMESVFPGIVIQAVFLTFGTLFTLLLAYRLDLINATENFKLGVVSATGGICFLYLASFFMRLVGGTHIPFIHSTGPIGIGFSVFVVIIAALNLVLDFDFIEKGVEKQAPKYMEWYAAFGLLVTLVWLYIEILHLLSKLRR